MVVIQLHCGVMGAMKDTVTSSQLDGHKDRAGLREGSEKKQFSLSTQTTVAIDTLPLWSTGRRYANVSPKVMQFLH